MLIELSRSLSAGLSEALAEAVVTRSREPVGGSGQGLESLLGMLPGGKDISGKFHQLQELSQKHGQDAEKLIKSAFEPCCTVKPRARSALASSPSEPA